MPEEKPQPTMSSLADYLEGKEGEVIRRWADAVRRAPDLQTPDEVTYRQLIDHLPSIYRRMIELLRQTGGEERTAEARRDARTHGRHRWQQGYRLDELLREIDILRQIILVDEFTDFMRQRPGRDAELEKREKRVIGGVLAELTNSSVRQFVESAERQARLHNEQLTAANEGLRQANDRLRELDESRLRLVRQLAHELNNILNNFGMAVAVLGRGGEEATRQKMLALLKSKTADMGALLRQLLNYSTLLAGREELHVEAFDLPPLYDEMEATFRPAAEAKGLAFEAACDPALGPVTSDPLKVKQVITNLLSNAVKYTDAGRIRLALRPVDEEWWAVVVEDTGRGIAAADLRRLFEEFRRFAPRAEIGGTGLGLAITKHLVELLGGEIKVESEPGRGSRFEVTLPRAWVMSDPL
jgi:signal transduction histidine kinase